MDGELLMAHQSTFECCILKVRDRQCRTVSDVIATEEPMEIRLRWQTSGKVLQRSIAVTMRTPGEDFRLAAGFLYSEGIITKPDDVVDIAYCVDESESQNRNIVTVTLSPGLGFDETGADRLFITNSSCGVCGKATLESLQIRGCNHIEDDFVVTADLLRSLPGGLRERQDVFSTTGGLHAAGLFDAEGKLLTVHEDIGRHNAVDKLIGHNLLNESLPLTHTVLHISGRAGFEILQKALMARVPVVAAVGAPSSLAIELATSFGITLVGFLKPHSFNVYSHFQRLTGPS